MWFRFRGPSVLLNDNSVSLCGVTKVLSTKIETNSSLLKLKNFRSPPIAVVGCFRGPVQTPYQLHADGMAIWANSFSSSAVRVFLNDALWDCKLCLGDLGIMGQFILVLETAEQVSMKMKLLSENTFLFLLPLQVFLAACSWMKLL